MLPDVQGFPARWRRSSRSFLASRSRFVAILSAHHAALALGATACSGQPCQKQPSTKTAKPQPDDDDVGTTRKIATVQPESDPPSVELTSQRNLRTGIRTPQALHEPAHRPRWMRVAYDGPSRSRADCTRRVTQSDHHALDLITQHRSNFAPRRSIIEDWNSCRAVDAPEDNSLVMKDAPRTEESRSPRIDPDREHARHWLLPSHRCGRRNRQLSDRRSPTDRASQLTPIPTFPRLVSSMTARACPGTSCLRRCARERGIPSNFGDTTDLGRFGLGLKTASFSQCRRLTVVSRRNGRDFRRSLGPRHEWPLLTTG